MAQPAEETERLIEQLRDPTRSHRALLALLSEAESARPALAKFLRTSRPSTVAEPRLLAVEGLNILKGQEALDALIEVATERLADIADPAVRLAEEAVCSAAARALADFPFSRARQTLLQLLSGKPLVGVAEAFEKLKEPRAAPSLVAWLADDFVAESALRALTAIGRAAVPFLLVALRHRPCGDRPEPGGSQRRRARILQQLAALAGPDAVTILERHLSDPVEAVRWEAARALVRHGNDDQNRSALRVALEMLDSSDSALRADCEDLLTEDFQWCREMVEEEIRKRQAQGEPEKPLTPRESTLEVLLRVHRRRSKPEKVQP